MGEGKKEEKRNKWKRERDEWDVKVKENKTPERKINI